mmetsp:Transcript_65240/g.170897  ORF Transcript_65240/g.170897 Transcript_65240/m.170897 type:complete len:286 (-) Transcript_65240:132-989(-)
MYFGFSLVALMTSASFWPSPSSSSPTHSIMPSSNCWCCSSACPTMRATGEPKLRPPKQATLSFREGGAGVGALLCRDSVRDLSSITTPGGLSRFVGMMKCATALVFCTALPMAQATRTDCSISRSFSESPMAAVTPKLRPSDCSKTRRPVALLVFGAMMSIVVGRLCAQADLPLTSSSIIGFTVSMFFGSQSTRMRLTTFGIAGVGASHPPLTWNGSGSRRCLCMCSAHSSDLSMTKWSSPTTKRMEARWRCSRPHAVTASQTSCGTSAASSGSPPRPMTIVPFM